MYLELLQKIYDLILSGTPITKETLNNINITEEQITQLEEDGVIYLTKKGTYNITSVNKLFLYGKKNLIQGNKRTALECFNLCYKIKPKHRETCLQLFLNAIQTHNYEDAYKYLYALENVSTNEHLRKDYKIYLYLLSQVSQVPELYQEKLAMINNDPLYLLHRKPKDNQKQDNVVVRLILKGKYKFALEKLNDFLSEDYDYEVHRLIIKSLLRQMIGVKEKYKSSLVELSKKRRYREIVSTLEEISLTRELRSDESNLLQIVNSIISIFETGEVPKAIENDATQVTEAIQCFDFAKALDLENEFILNKELRSDKSPIYILLVEINQLINNINRIKEKESAQKLSFVPQHLQNN